MDRIRSLVSGGAIGELREIQSDFRFLVSRPGNIRLSAELEGGALRDVGCYPVRLAQEFFGEHATAWAACERGGAGIDIETRGTLGYAGRRPRPPSPRLRPALRTLFPPACGPRPIP